MGRANFVHSFSFSLFSPHGLNPKYSSRSLFLSNLSRQYQHIGEIMASTDQTVLQFFPSPASLTAKVHPLVIFNICDCFVRRPDQAERVIGTLLGSVLPDGTVDIRNSYAVPHNESSDQVRVLFCCF